MISDPLDSIEDIRPFSGLEEVDFDVKGDLDWGDFAANIKIPGIVVSSIADGLTNTLLALRIGYITKSYITTSSEQLHVKKCRRIIKREALKKAVASISTICAEVAKEQTVRATTKTYGMAKEKAESLTRQAVMKISSLFTTLFTCLLDVYCG